jgi:hypothetical protein
MNFSNDPILNAVVIVFLALLAIGAFIAGALIFVPIAIVAGIGWLVFQYLNRPEPTSKIIAATQGALARADFPSPDDFLAAFHERYKKDCETAKIEPAGYSARSAALSAAYQIYEIEGLHEQPSPLTSVVDGTIEAARYRDFVLAKARLAANPARTITVFSNALTASLRAYTKALPALASEANDPYTEEENRIVVPLIDQMPNVAQTISDIVSPFFQPEAADLGLFKALRAQFERNFTAASEGSKKLIEPKDFKGTPREMVHTYLQDTPFEDMFLVEIPFTIPSQPTVHSWICAPPGAGKSTLLQHFIVEQLPLVAAGEASIVVIDSNRELVQAVSGLKVFAPGQPLAGKLLNIDIEDVEYPFALNLFDIGSTDANYTAADREALRNSVLSLYEYFFTGLLSAELTSRQNTLFNFTIQLLLEIPGATLDTLIDLMQPKGIEQYKGTLERLDPDARRFFELKFHDKAYDQTKAQVVDRLFAVKRIRTLARMFSAPRSKLNFFTEMAEAKVITINVPLNLLQEEGVEIVGRFFIAMILVAAQKRMLLPKEKRLPSHIFIDECQDILKRDTKIAVFLDQARKLNCSVTVAHQRLNQIQPYVLDALYGSTGIKYAAQVSDAAAHALARDMRCTPEFIQKQPPYHFATFVRGRTDIAVSLKIPSVDMMKMPRMTEAELTALREKTRVRYSEMHKAPEGALRATEVAPAEADPVVLPQSDEPTVHSDAPAPGWGRK